uniref:PorT family protein n=1 Tax=Roseihalotalea indica TaxID=2867963 RepID=A0AA49GL39_9BACT|nr:PorT family protein [Tunicatimonas sp. TK19036]
MKALITLVLIGNCRLQLFAQTFLEAKGGYSYNTLSTVNSSINSSETLGDGGFYFSGQISKKYYRFIVKTGAEVLQKNYFIKRLDEYSGIIQSSKNIYLTVPLAFQVKLIEVKKLEIHINAGAYGGYWITNNIEGTIPNAFNTTFKISNNHEVIQNFYLAKYTLKNKFNRTRDHRLEVGAAAGLQLQYFVIPSVSPVLSFSYYQAFTYTQKEYMLNQPKKVNQTMVFSGGILFRVR